MKWTNRANRNWFGIDSIKYVAPILLIVVVVISVFLARTQVVVEFDTGIPTQYINGLKNALEVLKH
jgi:hypothetical protein